MHLLRSMVESADELRTIWKDWRCGLYTNELTNDFIVQRWGPMVLDVLQIQEVAHTGQVDT